jgi:hypothetical protein
MDPVVAAQILMIGFVLGMLFGDCLDKIDPLSWKSVVRKAERCRCQSEDDQPGKNIDVQ